MFKEGGCVPKVGRHVQLSMAATGWSDPGALNLDGTATSITSCGSAGSADEGREVLPLTLDRRTPPRIGECVFGLAETRCVDGATELPAGFPYVPAAG